MAELSGGLRNRVPCREPLFQGWHMNEVPATTEKQNICKNEDFHIGHTHCTRLGVGVGSLSHETQRVRLPTF